MKKFWIYCAMLLGMIVGIEMFAGNYEVSAHGYVIDPISRVKNSKANGFGWSGGEISAPDIITCPHCIEAPTRLLDSGQLNGKLASAGLPGFKLLDVQTADRCVKTNIHTGERDFKWHLTQVHKTNRFRYYMTKQGWNSNKPLTLEDMDVIGVDGYPIGQNVPITQGYYPSNNPVHKITVPKDRSGYHVIYSVWDINDTPNSFYQAIDVNVIK